MKKIILASNNQGKIEEIKVILGDGNYAISSMKDAGFHEEIEEGEESFEENALKKAKEVMEATGEMVLADDSGLEVDALDGLPGVISVRFSGDAATDESNNKKLLQLLKDTPDNQRGARFRCVLAFLLPSGESFISEGICEGSISRKPKGKNGFGYDPIFIPKNFDKSFAELSKDEKNQISHRHMALMKMKELIEENLKDL